MAQSNILRWTVVIGASVVAIRISSFGSHSFVCFCRARMWMVSIGLINVLHFYRSQQRLRRHRIIIIIFVRIQKTHLRLPKPIPTLAVWEIVCVDARREPLYFEVNRQLLTVWHCLTTICPHTHSIQHTISTAYRGKFAQYIIAFATHTHSHTLIETRAVDCE